MTYVTNQSYIPSVCTAFFQLRNVVKLRCILSVSDAEKLIHVFMTLILDYCNALLHGHPIGSINKL